MPSATALYMAAFAVAAGTFGAALILLLRRHRPAAPPPDPRCDDLTVCPVCFLPPPCRCSAELRAGYLAAQARWSTRHG